MARKRSNDPLTAATTSYLWPFLKENGFSKSTARKFSKEVNDFFHQIWIDANGFSGKKSVRLHYCIMPNAQQNINGYSVGNYIPIGNVSTHENADKAMKKIIETLEKQLLKKMDKLSNYKKFTKEFNTNGYGIQEYKQEMMIKFSQWEQGTFSNEDLNQINSNRVKLKL